MFHFGQYNKLEDVIAFYADHMVKYTNEDRLNSGGAMSFILLADGYVAWRSPYHSLYDEGTMQFSHEVDWDEWEEKNEQAYLDLDELAKVSILELKAAKDTKYKAELEKAKKEQEEEDRKYELARLTAKYQDETVT